MSALRRSLLISFANRYTVLFIQFLSTIVLARLLTPEDLGVFAVGAVLVGVAHRLRDFGVGQYLIQEKELTPERIRTAFGVTLLIAWGLALLLFLASAPAAAFYAEEGVGRVILVLGVTFLLIPFGSVVLALLNRDMAFGALYRVSSVSAVVRAVAAVALAALGLGFMSLAWSALAGVVATILMANLYRPPGLPWRPGFGEFRRVLSFGGMASGAGLLKEVGAGAPDLIIGRALDMMAVGLFGRALGLIHTFDNLITSAVRPVMLPHFSAQHRAGQPLKDPYVHALILMNGLAWPFYGFLALMAYPMIRILYGPQWDAAVPIAQMLCLYGALSGLLYFSASVLVALGAVKQQLNMHLVLQPATIALVLLAAPHGLAAVGLALIASRLLALLLGLRLLRGLIGVTLREYGTVVRHSLALTVPTLIAPLGVMLDMEIGPDRVWLPLLVASAGAALGWLAGVLLLHHPLKAELRVFSGKLRARLQLRPGGTAV